MKPLLILIAILAIANVINLILIHRKNKSIRCLKEDLSDLSTKHIEYYLKAKISTIRNNYISKELDKARRVIEKTDNIFNYLRGYYKIRPKAIVDTTISNGDIVMIVDGSAFTTIDGEKAYIIDEINGTEIKHLPFKVINDNVITKHNGVVTDYLQDILVEYNGHRFYTASGLCRVIPKLKTAE